ncbi:2-isopropylmalate synthase [Algimonas porphyrae]|uniref:2-isopropylmalate synthase n=1 Tax=Algimonas porphyrae TaxID=1128113 RepID=A0ABQ5V390_9PROT|nr:2-isopropylmalate synthase [Algimonas porphyrae]GLQ21140.1 2-isopropylmalate synthase [Algimonas porphyrae]
MPDSYVKIFDTTLRDGEQAPGFSMSAGQKLAMAEALEGLRVDVIEAGFAAASPGDFEGIKAIAEMVKDVTVCSLARCNEGDIRASGEAIKPARSGRIHIFIATSPLHREFKLKMDKDEIVRRAVAGVELARSYTDDVEFSCEDAIRTERDYLKRVVEAAIKAGATTINIPDTVGYTTPEEITDLFRFLTTETEGADDVIFSAHCHDDLGLAVANSLAAVRGGARQVECALNGIGERAGNCAMEEVVMALRTRRDFFGLDTNVRTEGLYGASKLLSAITGQMVPRNKAIVGKNAFAHESGIHQHGVLANRETYEIMKPEHVGVSTDNLVLGKHSGRAALRSRAEKLGFTLSDNQLQSVFVAFKELADAKKEVFDSDIEALVLGEAVGQSGPWEIESLYVSAGSDENRMPKATVTLSHQDGRTQEHVSEMKGPMNAVFDAISQITDTPMRLEHYSVNSVSGGEDAMAEATVRVTTEFESYQGRGASTDTVLASARAYLDVINRIERRAVRQASIAAQH